MKKYFFKLDIILIFTLSILIISSCKENTSEPIVINNDSVTCSYISQKYPDASLAIEMDLSYLGLYDICPNIVNYNPSVLKLNNNQLTNIDLLTNLTIIQVLDISNNRISCFPDSINKIEYLSYLFAQNNRVKILPNGFYLAKNLREIELAGNSIEEISENIVQLNRLEWINVSSNKLKALPNSITQIPSLTRMLFNNNQITNIPEEFGNLKLLRELDFSHNQISEIPISICDIDSLRYLYLNDNKLTKLPENIGKLKHIIMITLWNNNFSEAEKARIVALFPGRNIYF